MSEAMFPKKTIYHSQLVQAGTIEALITSDVMPSKYKKEGMPNQFVEMKINGGVHQYIVETHEIGKKLAGKKGHVVQLTAIGGKDDAEMTVFDAAGPASSQASSARAQQPPPSNGGAPAPTTDTPESTVRHVKTLLMRSVHARVLCHEAAIAWADEIQSRYPQDAGIINDEDVRSVGTSLFIMLDKRGLIDAMPWKIGEKKEKPKQEPPKPAPRPVAPPPPVDPDEDDSEIPF